ncbi:unnamed protein product [Ilex paraguariensis]|uniref:Disease resistance protein At4g27190-like leucine-rich repeats domain-containing protein n=1 Tax=Ilex paraguariensis TaxID=185542 RepID=A0ABC8TM87_9AQUA
MEGGLKGVLCNASALDLVTCGGISGLPEAFGRSSWGGLPSLKLLTITSCDEITKLIRGQNIRGSMLPNLKRLVINRLRNLETILDGMVPNRVSLGRLKTIEVVDCPRLKVVISYGLLQQIQNLEEIRHIEVSNCPMLKQLPLSVCNAATITEIRGEIEWWSNLRWKDENIKSTFNNVFRHAQTLKLAEKDKWDLYADQKNGEQS